MITVALDAMGGDHGPGPLVAGALAACGEDVRVLLVGDSAVLRPLLDEARPSACDPHMATRVDVVHAAAAIEMGEDPALAVRAKPDASVRVVVRLLAEGAAQVGVSAGSTGATLAAALLGLGRLGGIRRPALAGALPVVGPSGREVILVDAGGSPDILPPALVDWARLGAAYARARGSIAPAVGLLNVGTEPGKGNELSRAGFDLLRAWGSGGGRRGRFIGNVEPGDVLRGAADVVVTDGFTGNVVIKTLEAAFADRIAGPPGALILGVPGTVVVAHGAAGAEEIAGSISTGRAVAAAGWLDEVRSEIV